MRLRFLPAPKHFHRQVPDQHAEIYVMLLCISSLLFCMFCSLVGLVPKKYATSRNPSCSVLSFQEEKFGRYRQQSKSTDSQVFYFSQILKFSLGGNFLTTAIFTICPIHTLRETLQIRCITQFYLSTFIMEALQKALQQFICVVNSFCIFAHYPDHGSSGIWFIQGI